MIRQSLNSTQNVETAFCIQNKLQLSPGLVSPAEIKFVMNNLGEDIEPEDIDALIAQVDKDADGYLNYKEFVNLMTWTREIFLFCMQYSV